MTSSTLTRARTRIPSALLVAVGLAVGFSVAQGTGIRALGGAVFALGGLGAGAAEEPLRGAPGDRPGPLVVPARARAWWRLGA